MFSATSPLLQPNEMCTDHEIKHFSQWRSIMSPAVLPSWPGSFRLRWWTDDGSRLISVRFMAQIGASSMEENPPGRCGSSFCTTVAPVRSGTSQLKDPLNVHFYLEKQCNLRFISKKRTKVGVYPGRTDTICAEIVLVVQQLVTDDQELDVEVLNRQGFVWSAAKLSENNSVKKKSGKLRLSVCLGLRSY